MTKFLTRKMYMLNV